MRKFFFVFIFVFALTLTGLALTQEGPPGELSQPEISTTIPTVEAAELPTVQEMILGALFGVVALSVVIGTVLPEHRRRMWRRLVYRNPTNTLATHLTFRPMRL
jgi:hypothetical protein